MTLTCEFPIIIDFVTYFSMRHDVFISILYGCKTWSLAMWEKHRLRVLANRVVRRIFGSKRDELIGEWRKIHNE